MKNILHLSLNDAQETLLYYTGYNQQTGLVDEKMNAAGKHKQLISDTCSIHKSFKQDIVGTRVIGAHKEPSKHLLTTISNYLKSSQQAIDLIKEKLLTLGFSAQESSNEVIDAYIFNFAYAFLCMHKNKDLNVAQERKLDMQDLNIIDTLQTMHPETVSQISLLSANVLSPLLFIINSTTLVSTLNVELPIIDDAMSVPPTSHIEINVTNNSIDILIETKDSRYDAVFNIKLDADRKKAIILSNNLRLPQEVFSDVDIQDFILENASKKGGTAFALGLDTDHYLDNMAKKIYDFFDDHKHFEGWVYNTSCEFSRSENPFNKEVFVRKIADFKDILKINNSNFISEGLERRDLQALEDNVNNMIASQAESIDLSGYVKRFRNYKRDYLNLRTWITNHVNLPASYAQDMKQSPGRKSRSSISSNEEKSDDSNSTGYFSRFFGS